MKNFAADEIEQDLANLKREFTYQQLDAVTESFWEDFKQTIHFENILIRIKYQKEMDRFEKERIDHHNQLVITRTIVAENQRIHSEKLKLEREIFEFEKAKLEFKSELQQKANELEKMRQQTNLVQVKRDLVSSVFYSPPSPTFQAKYQPVGASSGTHVGVYKSNGCANNRQVYSGVRGGLYYLNTSGSKQYVNKNTVKFN